MDVALAGSLFNPVGYAGTGDLSLRAGADNGLGGNVNASVHGKGLRGLLLSNPTIAADAARVWRTGADDHLARGLLPDALAARRLV